MYLYNPFSFFKFMIKNKLTLGPGLLQLPSDSFIRCVAKAISQVIGKTLNDLILNGDSWVLSYSEHVNLWVMRSPLHHELIPREDPSHPACIPGWPHCITEDDIELLIFLPLRPALCRTDFLFFKLCMATSLFYSWHYFNTTGIR